MGMPWLIEHLHLRSAGNACRQICGQRRLPPALARKPMAQSKKCWLPSILNGKVRTGPFFARSDSIFDTALGCADCHFSLGNVRIMSYIET